MSVYLSCLALGCETAMAETYRAGILQGGTSFGVICLSIVQGMGHLAEHGPERCICTFVIRMSPVCQPLTLLRLLNRCTCTRLPAC